MKKPGKAIVVKGGAGLSRRQLASLKGDGGAEFPPLPSLVTRPVDSTMERYASEAFDRYKKSGVRGASPFLRMLINPFDATSVRYPDESIVPSAMVHLTTSSTYTVSANGANFGVVSFLNWKCRTASATSPFHATLVPPVDTQSAWSYSDYGTPQSSWSALSAVDRTLACAIRVRVVGLPTSTFKPSGTFYFLQYQPGESIGSFDTESECLQAVTAKKGFSLTVSELDRLGAVHIPFLPQGPMSYVFSGTNADAPSGLPDATTNSVVAPNGGLFVIGFGLQQGAILRYDYSHHVEYIPRVTAAGLVETKVELPSVVQREGIAQASQAVLRSIGGGTSSADVKILRGGPPPGGAFGSGSGAGSAFDSIASAFGLMGQAAPAVMSAVKAAGWV